MKLNTTCLALTFALLAVNMQGASVYPVIDSGATKPELLALLRANYVDYDKIHAKSEDLHQMIAESKGGLSVASATSSAARMYATVLPGNVIYWRAGSFTPSTSWDDLAAQANRAAATSAGLILDLRSNTTPDDFEGALRVASFLSKGQTGLNFRQDAFHAAAFSTANVLQGRPTLIVLTNRHTRGAAEILAASLQARGALVMGGATEGKAAIFSEVPLASGGVLRYATAHVYLSNGTDLWDRPVVPDVTTSANARDEATALMLIDREQVADVISEDAPRHRMCEAALVAGQDPEQDAFIASHEQAAPAPSAPATRDIALLEAIDSLKAIRVLQGESASPEPRIVNSVSSAGQTVIASSNAGR
jgi:hypothetical protein